MDLTLLKSETIINFLGQTERPTFRLLTGWHTFDRAFINRKGDIGFPVRGPGAIQMNWKGELAWSKQKGKWFDLEKGHKQEDEDGEDDLD